MKKILEDNLEIIKKNLNDANLENYYNLILYKNDGVTFCSKLIEFNKLSS